MKKFLVLFLCLLAIFVIVSCKDDPTEGNNEPAEPAAKQETPGTTADILAGTAFYRLTATVEAKRFSLQYLDDEEGAFDPQKDDVLTLKYRTNHAVTCFFLRDGSGNTNYIPAEDLVPEKKYHNISASGDSYVTGPDADGWYTLTFTFAETTASGFRLELANYESSATKFKPDQYLDIKDLQFKGERLTIEEPDPEVDEFKSDHGIWNDGKTTGSDQTNPTLAIYCL